MPIKASVIILLCGTKKDKILLLKHNNTFYPGYPWGLPGGMVDDGETYYEAMKREFKEEVTIDLPTIHFLKNKNKSFMMDKVKIFVAYTNEDITKKLRKDKKITTSKENEIVGWDLVNIDDILNKISPYDNLRFYSTFVEARKKKFI